MQILDRLALISAKQFGLLFMVFGLLKGVAMACIVFPVFLDVVAGGHWRHLGLLILFPACFALPLVVSGAGLYLWARKKPDYWWPVQSRLEREILSHLTQRERALLGRQVGVPSWLAVLGVLGLVAAAYAEGSWRWLAAPGAALFAVGLLWSSDSRRRALCATPYAREEGITPTELRRAFWRRGDGRNDAGAADSGPDTTQ